MALAIAVGVVLVAGFWHETPANVDASSNGNPGQNTERAAQPGGSAETPAPQPAPSNNP